MPKYGAGSGGSIDGWTAANETWTYVSATTFTVPDDQTLKLSKGTRIKLDQTTTKYFVVVDSSFSVDTTTVTVTGGDDYTLADEAITDNFYSYAANPQGYPGWFNWAPTFGGFSASPTTGTAKFAVVGRTCTILLQYIAGTSNATSFTFVLPIASLIGGRYQAARVTNNGADSLTPGMVEFLVASTTANLYRDWGGTGWTASGGKNATLTAVYEF